MSEAEKMTKVERKAQKPGKAERGEDVILVIVGIFAAV